MGKHNFRRSAYGQVNLLYQFSGEISVVGVIHRTRGEHFKQKENTTHVMKSLKTPEFIPNILLVLKL